MLYYLYGTDNKNMRARASFPVSGVGVMQQGRFATSLCGCIRVGSRWVQDGSEVFRDIANLILENTP